MLFKCSFADRILEGSGLVTSRFCQKKQLKKLNNKKASIKTIHTKKILEKVRKLVEFQRLAVIDKLVDKRRGQPRNQHKRKIKHKNGALKVKLEDILDEVFLVKSEVPELEREFYEDQCKDRKMFIEGVDVKETRKQNYEAEKLKTIQNNKRIRQEGDKKKQQKEKERKARNDNVTKQVDTSNDCDEEDNEEVPKKQRRFSGKEKDIVKELLPICERFNISDTAAAILFNKSNELCDNNQNIRINQSQISKTKKKARQESVKTFETENVTGIGFDERVDKTKMVVGVGSKGRKRFELQKEEHCAVVVYPKTEYAGHIVPPDGRAATLASELQQFTVDRKISWDNITTLISDGCEKMVGWIAGVHASLEKLHGRPFARLICIFHHQEKSFEVVFTLYSGHTTGPSSYSGDVGKSIKGDIHRKPIVAFKVLPNPSLLLLLDAVSDETF